MIMSQPLEASGTPWLNLAITPGDDLERYLVEYREVALTDRSALAAHYRLYAQEPTLAVIWAETHLAPLLHEYPELYVEIRDNVMLAFRPYQSLEPTEMTKRLLAFAASMGATANNLSDVGLCYPGCLDALWRVYAVFAKRWRC